MTNVGRSFVLEAFPSILVYHTCVDLQEMENFMLKVPNPENYHYVYILRTTFKTTHKWFIVISDVKMVIKFCPYCGTCLDDIDIGE